MFATQAGHVEQELALRLQSDDQSRQVQRILTALGDAETGQRGYLLTGRARYLQPYTAAVKSLPGLLKSLDAIPVQDRGIPGHVARIRELTGLKLAELAETIRLHDAGQQQAALKLVQTDAGQRYMEELRNHVTAIQDDLQSFRDRLDRQSARSRERTRHLAILIVTILAFFIVACAIQVTALLATRSRYEVRIARSEDLLNRAGRVAGVGAWEIDIGSDEVLWSDQVRRILEIEGDFEPNVDTMGNFMPDANGVLRDAVFAARYQGAPFDLELPATTQTGRHIIVHLVGEAEMDAKSTPTRIVGSLQDITARKQVEERLHDLTEIIESTSDFVVKTDWKGVVSYLNPAARAHWTLAPDDDLSSIWLSDFITPETRERVMLEIRPAVKQHGVWVGETTVLVGERPVCVHTVVIGHRDDKGRIDRYSGVMRDITAMVEARQELQRQTATLDAVVEAIPAVVVVFDAQFKYRFVNRAFERWRGVKRESVVGHGVDEILGQAEFDRSWTWAQRALAGETVSYEKDYPETRLKYLNVTYVPLRLEDGTIDGFIAVAQDITRHREEENRLLDLSERDALTGLYNRAGLDKYLGAKMEAGGADSLALLYIDLDHFKAVNDTHGHSVGDELLQQFAQRLQLLVRGADAVARLGGDEFAIALADVAAESGAHAVAEQVLRAARKPFNIRDLNLLVAASVGVAFDASDASGIKGLIERADEKLYVAKAAGRDRKA